MIFSFLYRLMNCSNNFILIISLLIITSSRVIISSLEYSINEAILIGLEIVELLNGVMKEVKDIIVN